jgi:CBS domain-containing protein
MTVTAILSLKGGDVVTIKPTASLVTAAKVLAERRIGALVVTDTAERVAGIRSERDIVRALAEPGPVALDESVDQVMTRRVVSCTEAMTVSEIMERMTAGKFRQLPVIKLGSLVGIVSIGDVVKYRLAAMQRESQSVRDCILAS